MGLFFSRIIRLFTNWGEENHRILILGLDAAGKTTILYKLKLGKTVVTTPTIGFNIEEIRIPNTNITFTVWDVPDQSEFRRRPYFRGSAGLLFAVDSADPERFSEAADLLQNVLSDEDMTDVPVVVLANKQDLPLAVEPSQLIEKLCLPKLANSGHKWHLQATVAPSGVGLLEAFEAMARLSKEFVKQRESRS